MNQVRTVVSCCVWSLIGGRICDTYQIFANRRSCTYCTLCARHRFLAYAFLASARTALVTLDQLSFLEFSMLVPKVNPSILTWLQNSIPNTVAGAVHLPMASALDFFALRRASVARSYSCMALSMMEKSVGWVTKTVTSSAYATTVTIRARCPIVIPGSLSSNVRRRGWRQCVYYHTQRATLPGGVLGWYGPCHVRRPLYSRRGIVHVLWTRGLSYSSGVLEIGIGVRPLWKAFWKSKVNTQKAVSVVSECAIASRTMETCSRIEFHGTQKCWLVWRWSSNTWRRRWT